MYSKEKLLKMLSSDNASVRYDACEWIRVSQDSSPEIINALEKASHDLDKEVAARADLALQADVHHQMAIKMGIVEPDKEEVETTQPDQSPKPIQPSLAENQDQSTNISDLNNSGGQEEAKPNLVSPPARVFRRMVALFIDMIFLAVFCIIIGLIFGSILEYLGFYTRLISAVIALLYFGYGNSRDFNGNTLGKRVMHLWVKAADGGYITIKQSLLRSSILVLFFLFSGWQLPISSTNIIYQLFQFLIYFGLGGAIVYLIIFNRKTGQNLDDLLVGTRVVYQEGEWVESYPTTQRKHINGAIAVLILIPLLVWGISQAMIKAPVFTASLERIMPLYNALIRDQRFYQAGVNEQMTQYSSGQQQVRVLFISLWPRDYLTDTSRQLLAQNVVEIAQNYVPLSDYTTVQVQIVSGYDLGFFDRSTIWICYPPIECSQKVVKTQVLRLFNYTMTYLKSK